MSRAPRVDRAPASLARPAHATAARPQFTSLVARSRTLPPRSIICKQAHLGGQNRDGTMLGQGVG